MRRLLLLAVEAAILFALFNAAIRAWQGARAVRRFRRRYGSEGRDLLLVYSPESPWAPYVEGEWAQRWSARMVLLRWPQEAQEGGPAAALFRAISGSRPRTPVAVVVPVAGGIRVVRFWRVLRRRASGDGQDRAQALRDAEAQVEAALARP